MASEIKAEAITEIKESSSDAPIIPWWHEVGFFNAGKDILEKFLATKSARECRVALRLEMRRLNAEKEEFMGQQTISPSKQKTSTSPDKKNDSKSNSKNVKKEGKTKGVQKGPPPLPPPHLRTSGATLSDAELSSVSMIRVQPGWGGGIVMLLS